MPVTLRTHTHDTYTEYIATRDAPLLGSCRGILTAAAVAVAVWAVAAVHTLSSHSQVACAVLVLLVWLLATGLQVTSESLVVLDGVGVLLVSRRGCWTGQSRQFLDLADIHSVFVHETLTTTTIRTHLALLSYNSGQLAVAFPHLSPRLDVATLLYNKVSQQLGLRDGKIKGQ